MFEAAETRINTKCSLTVCEGVSQSEEQHPSKAKFPHCMWGCIERQLEALEHFGVPSLYVRVYRHKELYEQVEERSLTVCEGVSSCLIKSYISRLFPHCMWGCIDVLQQDEISGFVPSLYVRVYRRESGAGAAENCSLTVCDGISCICMRCLIPAPFHHCMWGYIVKYQQELDSDSVPSLYVRVYRRTSFSGCVSVSSLSIREGVS